MKSQILFPGKDKKIEDILHKMSNPVFYKLSNPVFWEKYEKITPICRVW